jgi:hypothetical protein
LRSVAANTGRCRPTNARWRSNAEFERLRFNPNDE